MNKELDFVRGMFDSIAPRYDFLNRLLSLRQDVYWRREMVRAAQLPAQPRVLDVACGTCDVALEIHSQSYTPPVVTGLDFSYGMLSRARQKLATLKITPPIDLVNGNALSLPFEDNRFDAVFIAFGIRNIMDRQKALTCFFNVLKPGGTAVVLELTTPEIRSLKTLYLLYFKQVLPWIGRFFSKDRHAYQYLPDSVLKFPPSREFAGIMRASGFKQIKFKPMTLGIVTLFTGIKEEPVTATRDTP